MKRSLHTALLGLVLLVSALPALAAKQLYTCGMHPQIIRDAPGDCPICGMKLQPILASSAAPATASGERKIKYYKSTMNPGEVSPQPGKDSMGMDMVPVYDDSAPAGTAFPVDTATRQRMNLKTAPVTRGPVLREFRTVGTIAFDEAGLRDVTTKYEGWIEKLDVDATWTAVKAGDPLFEIYSPELYNAERNYLVARSSEGEAGGVLTAAARTRLELLDIPADEIAALERTGVVPRTRTFRAPVSGVVIEKMGVAGQMVKPGERIYRLADLSTVWVLAQVYTNDLPFVREGQTAVVHTTYGPERSFTGKVALLLPQVDDQTRAVTARIVLSNADGYLRPGMYTDVNFAAQLADSAVLVPDLAVLRSGERNTVFVARDDDTFEPREVTLGNRSAGGNYEVLAGLSAGERIVTSGQFLLDSESQLREAILKMLKTEATPVAAAANAPATATAPMPEMASPAAQSETTVHAAAADAASMVLYTCPMDEHADVVSDHPGDCPKCGMKLVPAGETEHAAESEAAWRRQHPAAAPAMPMSPAQPPAHTHGN